MRESRKEWLQKSLTHRKFQCFVSHDLIPLVPHFPSTVSESIQRINGGQWPVETGRGEPERMSPPIPSYTAHISRDFIHVCYTALPHEGGGLTSLHRSELAKPGRRGTAAGQLDGVRSTCVPVYPRLPYQAPPIGARRKFAPLLLLRAPRVSQSNWPQRKRSFGSAAKPRTGGLTRGDFGAENT
jgi:hypothetical protein